MEPWLWALAVSMVSALIAIIYRAGQSRDDKQDVRAEKNERALAEHVRDDISAHERLRAVETKVEQLDREVTGLRERWHDLRGEISQTLSNWYMSVVKMINKDDR
jgi:uncharacterized membrane protein